MQKEKIVIVGGCGNIGKRLKTRWPEAITIDRDDQADFVVDLGRVDAVNSQFYDIINTADVVIHLATSADPEAPDLVHFQSLENSAKLTNICAKAGVRKLILASSDWAEPNGLSINAYGYSKRAIEVMAEMYSHQQGCTAIALRIGWVPGDATEVSKAPKWLAQNYWDDSKLISEFERAIGTELNDIASSAVCRPNT